MSRDFLIGFAVGQITWIGFVLIRAYLEWRVPTPKSPADALRILMDIEKAEQKKKKK